MPRRFFKKFAVKHQRFRDQPVLRPFRHLLGDNRLWSIRRKTVVPAVAVGVFFAFIPLPGHPLWASLYALWRRVNIPVAALTTFISNPLTIGPLYWASYQVGARVLRIPPRPIKFDLSIEWATTVLVQIWQPMVIGWFVLGSVSALISYAVLDLLWRSSVTAYKRRKYEQRRKRESRKNT